MLFRFAGALACVKISTVMGTSRFHRFFVCAGLSALALTAAFLSAVILAAPAAAKDGGGGDIDEKPWDTDNLVYTQGTVSYSAENFRVPFHQYRGYSTSAGASPAAKEACAPGGVADAFFQTDTAPGRNDFPVLKQTGTTWAESATGTKNTGCAKFVDAQLTMSARARSNGGYYLDSQGNLKLEENVSSARFLRNPASRTRTYGTWSASSPARTGYQSLTRASASDSAIPATVKTYGILAHTASGPGCRSRAGGLALANGDADPYLARTDNSLANRGTSGSYERVSSPQPSGAWEPSAAAISTQNEFVIRSGSVWYALAHRGICNRAVFLNESQDTGSDTNTAALCPARMHPRGQDGKYAIGESTGRTLGSITSATEIQIADKHWCRSDVRYKIAYKAQDHGKNPPAGVTVADAGDIFYAFGRSGCYYTAISISGSGKCEYAHPVPQCTDPSTRQKRDWTAEELATWHNETAPQPFAKKSDGTSLCEKKATPARTGFSRDACVIADLQIYENRPARENAEPGVIANHRTVTYNAAWNLHIASAHPKTASPPRDTNPTTGDPDGCADGSCA